MPEKYYHLDSWNYQNQIHRQKSGMVFDFWPCGPAKNIKDKSGKVILRGAYPAKFLDNLQNSLSIEWPKHDMLDIAHICAGSIKPTQGITVDIDPQFNPNLLADAQEMADEFLTRYNQVQISLADPPYNKKRAEGYYGKPILSKIKMLKEMVKITKSGGLVGLLDQVSPSIGPHIPQLKRVALIGVTSLPNQDIRAFTLWRRL